MCKSSFVARINDTNIKLEWFGPRVLRVKAWQSDREPADSSFARIAEPDGSHTWAAEETDDRWVVRGDSLEAKMSQYLVDRICDHPKIDVHFRSVVSAVAGTDHVEAVTLRDRRTNVETIYDASALFIFIGAMPCTGWLHAMKGAARSPARANWPGDKSSWRPGKKRPTGS